MDLKEATVLLRQAQEERLQARETLQVAEATIESSQLIIQGIIRRYPELAKDANEYEMFWESTANLERPKGSDAVHQVLQVRENKWYSISGLVDMLEANGWLPESGNVPNAVRTAVERLVKTEGSNVEKSKTDDGTVVYRYHEPEPPPPEYRYEEEPF